MKEMLQKHKQYLLTGVSHVIPFIACGGILIALSLAYAFRFHLQDAHGGPDVSQAPWFNQDMFNNGKTARRKPLTAKTSAPDFWGRW
jgi:fructose-specific phosphotransferase system IIC component